MFKRGATIAAILCLAFVAVLAGEGLISHARGQGRPLRLAQDSSPADEARQKAEDQAKEHGAQHGAAQDDSPAPDHSPTDHTPSDHTPGDNQPGDHPGGGGGGNNVGGQINDLGQTQEKTQEKPPVGNAPPTEGQAVAPPGHPMNNTTDGSQIACHAEPDGGWFQPVQAVYQDEKSFRYVTYDAGGKPHENPQLEEIDLGSYTAHLPMIEGKYTVLMGVERYKSHAGIVSAGSHDAIVIKIKSNCTLPKTVYFRFRARDGNGEQTWYSDEPREVKLEGPPDKKTRIYNVTLIKRDGVPETGEMPFMLHGVGYRFTADLVDEYKHELGFRVDVAGPIVETNPLKVQFVPVIIGRGSESTGDKVALQEEADDLATEAAKYIPDYFPLAPNGLPTKSDHLQDLSYLDTRTDRSTPTPFSSPFLKGVNMLREAPRDLFAARMGSELATAGIESGAQRVVAVIPLSEFPLATPPSTGDAINSKVVFVAATEGENGGYQPPTKYGELQKSPPKFDEKPVLLPAEQWQGDILDVTAHELAHVLPQFLFSDVAMKQECGRDYHGKPEGTADGERVTLAGNPMIRVNVDNSKGLMGAFSPAWIEQCTYAHLIPALAGHPDPQLLLVRGVLVKAKKIAWAELHPSYDMTGESDAVAAPVRDWALNFADASGHVLKAYPVTPQWPAPETWNRVAAPLFIRVPFPTGAASATITYAGKVLARQSISPTPPSLHIDAPLPDAVVTGNTMDVRWTAHGVGRTLLASVYYSNDDGYWYRNRIFETTKSAIDVPIDRRFPRNQIKVVVTDGSRSAEQIVRVRTH